MQQKVVLHEGQVEVARDQHRFRVVCAGRRWGKSVLAQLITLQWALRNQGAYWIVAPTYRQAKQIHWRQLQQIVPKEITQKKNEVELSITLTNGSIIELKGAENPDALRGVKLRGLIIDEIASIRNWDWLWSEVLRPTLTDYEAPAIFISTPKGFNHFYDLYEQGQGKTDQYKSWRFASYDNPYISSKEIDNAKKELTEDTFYQEYMADFRTAVGLAHREWNHEINLIDPFTIPENWNYGRGVDYGSAHPTASVRIAVDSDDNWFVDRIYNEKERYIKDHAREIQAQDYGLPVVPAWGDPSGKQWFAEFQKEGLTIQPSIKEIGQEARGWVEYCVNQVNQRLKPIPGHIVRLPNGDVIEDAPRLFVFNTEEVKPLVRQIENLKWRRNRTSDEVLPQLDESDDPTGGHYDLCAALRYLTVNYKPRRSDESKLAAQRNTKKRKNWSVS